MALPPAAVTVALPPAAVTVALGALAPLPSTGSEAAFFLDMLAEERGVRVFFEIFSF